MEVSNFLTIENDLFFFTSLVTLTREHALNIECYFCYLLTLGISYVDFSQQMFVLKFWEEIGLTKSRPCIHFSAIYMLSS